MSEHKMRVRAQTAEPDITGTPNTVARYIANMADELAQLAKRNGLEPLAYILDMARLEADEVSKSSGHLTSLSHTPS